LCPLFSISAPAILDLGAALGYPTGIHLSEPRDLP
jgi:hypothetical protein